MPSRLSDRDYQLHDFLEQMQRCDLRVPEPNSLGKKVFGAIAQKIQQVIRRQ